MGEKIIDLKMQHVASWGRKSKAGEIDFIKIYFTLFIISNCQYEETQRYRFVLRFCLASQNLHKHIQWRSFFLFISKDSSVLA